MKHSDLLEVINYTLDGNFYWKKPRRGVKVGKVLGTDNGFGYKRITVFGNSYYAHRLAWFFSYKKWPEGEIDHIDGDKANNRISNLRDVSSQGNAQNILKAKKSSNSKVLGVSWHKGAKKWQAHICVYKKRIYLGLFSSVHEAKKVYDIEKRKVVIK